MWHSVGDQSVKPVTSSLAQAWLGTVGTNALILLFSTVGGIIAARLLGPDGRGVLAALIFWPGLLAHLGFLSLGEAAVYRANNTNIDRRSFAASLVLLAIAMTLPILSASYLLLPSLLGPERAVFVPLTTAFLLFFIPMNFTAQALLAFDRAERQFARYNFLRLLEFGAYPLALLVLVTVDKLSVTTALWAICLGATLVIVTRLLLWHQDLHARPVMTEMAALLRQGMLFHGTTLITILTGHIDRIVVMRFFSNAEIGYYVVALTLATVGLGVVTQSVHAVLAPHLAAEPDRNLALQRMVDGLRRSTILLLVGSAASLLLIPYVLPLLFGKAFLPASPVAMLLVLAFVPLALRQIAIQCLRAFGDARIGIKVEGVAFAAFCLLILPALEFLQLRGVAISLLLANALALIVLARLMHSRYGIRPAAWLLPSIVMLSDLRSVISHLRRLCSA